MHHIALTPFGRQPVTSGLLASRQLAAEGTALPRIDKWTLFDQLRIARRDFGIADRDLAVLYALLSFLPERELAQDAALIVFPSNAKLAERAHGMAESTLRRHLATLVGAGLIWRQDSPNGKRYARRDDGGALQQAYGFDLRPLLLRSAEISAAASAETAALAALKQARDRLVLQLRDAAKLLTYAQTEGAPPLCDITARLTLLRGAVRRRNDLETLARLNLNAGDILADILRHLTPKTAILGGTAAQSDCHHTNSEQDSSESEPKDIASQPTTPPTPAEDLPRSQASALPPHLIPMACPELRLYARNPLRSWHDIVATAHELHGMMGISAATWSKAQQVMGAESAAATLAAILQRFSQIKNPGAYLHNLCQRAAAGTFSAVSMIMALLRQDHPALS